MYTMTLQDGKKLKNLELNGNNYIAEGVIEDSVFTDNLASVTVSDGKTTEKYTDMMLLSNRVEDGRSWFVIGEISAWGKSDDSILAEMQDMKNAMSMLLTGEGN